jgi:hypothetical protein
LALQAMFAFILATFCVFSYHTNTHIRGAILNAVPIVWLHMLFVAAARVGRVALQPDLVVQAATWIVIAACVGALLACRGRLLRNRAEYDTSVGTVPAPTGAA